jgi:hypothetical protein
LGKIARDDANDDGGFGTFPQHDQKGDEHGAYL